MIGSLFTVFLRFVQNSESNASQLMKWFAFNSVTKNFGCVKSYNFSDNKWDENLIVIPKYETKHIEMINKFIQLDANSIGKNLNNITFNTSFEFFGIKTYLQNFAILISLGFLSLLIIYICIKLLLKKLFKWKNSYFRWNLQTFSVCFYSIR